jgi:protein-S-isoprenylcysteine O-methyltransferase Ste14
LVLCLDYGERAVVALLFARFAEQFLGNVLARANPSTILSLVSESAVVVFVLFRRRAQEMSLRFEDWVLAFGATCLPLLLLPNAAGALGPWQIGWTLQCIGLGAQVWSKLTLFRNFGIAPALRGVTATGPYRLMRHPMYAAYVIGQIGFLYAFPSAWNAGVLAVWAGAQLLRIEAEERLLRTSPIYVAYAKKVRWRLIPGVY